MHFPCKHFLTKFGEKYKCFLFLTCILFFLVLRRLIIYYANCHWKFESIAIKVIAAGIAKFYFSTLFVYKSARKMKKKNFFVPIKMHFSLLSIDKRNNKVLCYANDLEKHLMTENSFLTWLQFITSGNRL